MNQIEMVASDRIGTGKSDSRRLRHALQVPAVIYGGTEAPANIAIEQKVLFKALEKESFSSSIITLNVNGKKLKVVLKDLQRHPYKPKLMHADFQRIDETHKITMHVPLHFIGADVAPGVKVGAGIVTHQMNDLEISCLPADLPEFIEVDLSKLGLDEALHLSDLHFPKGVSLHAQVVKGANNDLPVASIHLPRGAVEEAATAAAAAASATPEKEKK